MPVEQAEVVAVTRDLFLQSRIGEAVRSVGMRAAFVSEEEDLRALGFLPNLVIIDLASADYDPFSCIEAAKTAFPSAKLLAFFPHVRSELKARAEALGVNYVVPNSGLIASLRRIISGGRTC